MVVSDTDTYNAAAQKTVPELYADAVVGLGQCEQQVIAQEAILRAARRQRSSQKRLVDNLGEIAVDAGIDLDQASPEGPPPDAGE